jgi:hypothetical protein
MQANIAAPNPADPKQAKPWFKDGNLILEAENTQFCVHRSVICASSSVFNDMFSLPLLVPGDKLVDDCPVVRLSDSATDLHHVLKAIYDRG